MRFVSTRDGTKPVFVSEAMGAGLASDGGLFVPEAFPLFTPSEFKDLSSFPEIATRVLEPFFKGDALAPALKDICNAAFNFPVPLRELKSKTAVLELFHGPSAAFKDIGARFLAECFSRMNNQERLILVATSGDTGGAVAAAFHLKPRVRVIILFPKGGVSERQRRQLTSWGGNIRAFAVDGTFDDCQRLVKTALTDAELQKTFRLSSANSINVGRLLPQMAYFAAASLAYVRLHGASAAFAVPSGNVGNALAALWAKKMGFPIRQVAFATNANRVIPDYIDGAEFKARPSKPTLANAMDVGNPSNFERILHLFGQKRSALRREASALSVSDDQIRTAIRRGEFEWKSVWCPHTATAVVLREEQKTPDWIIVATAHPAKFESIVEPLIGHSIAIPPSLAEILKRPSSYGTLKADYAVFRAVLTPPA